MGFVKELVFKKQWAELGLDDEDMVDLQEILDKNPQGAPIIAGTGGARKLRIALKGRGKSGGARVIYAVFLGYGKIYLLEVYGKSKQENISMAKRNELKKQITGIKNDYRRKNQWLNKK